MLFAGCSADHASGKSGTIALAKLMQKAGEDFAILGNREKCCGLYAFDLGYRREYERLKDVNVATLAQAGVKKVIVACGSCQRIWREYAKEASGFEVMHGVEFVAQAVRSGQLCFTKSIDMKVTYHDSCHLGRGCGVYDPPREFSGRFPLCSWSRWSAINAGPGVVAAAAACPRPILS